MSEPQVLGIKILGMRVCVPSHWSDAEIDEWANRVELCGTERGWSVSKRPEVAPIVCDADANMKHVVLDC